MFQGSLWVLTESFEEVFQRSFREISRVLQESSKGIKVRLKGISRSFKEGSRIFERSSICSRVFQESFKAISSKIEGCLKGVFSYFQAEIQRGFQGSFK